MPADTPSPRQLSEEERALWTYSRALIDAANAAEANPSSLTAAMTLARAQDDYAAAVGPDTVCAALTALSTEREAGERNAKLVDGFRTALRSIGPVYFHVDAAADRATRRNDERAADALELVYGRLVWMDHALGTRDERVAPHLAATSTETPHA